ncbi:MAG: hypothetical protein LUI12_01875 [Clostridiales bacterium]|nr:hypothetical protein [Clostridiales bacterium]
MADVETKATETEITETQAQETEQEQGNAPTVESLMAELAQQRAENAKLKNASDKASREASEYKKQLRAKQTAEEQADEAKREAEEQHNEYVRNLESFQKQAMAKDRYLAQGMSADMATKAAEAEVNGDMDALATIQKQYTDSVVKEKELEWKKLRPEVQAGVGSEAITKEQFASMGIAEKSKLYRENKAEYDRLMKL